MFELSLPGPASGNPFTQVRFHVRFFQDEQSINVPGFYDGQGTYRARFMPPKKGRWNYRTESNLTELHDKKGDIQVTGPSAANHGPVRVANTYHFAYADGTPYKPVGTTSYVWTLQGEALEKQTLQTLSRSPFNKIRFCVFPKRYDWSKNEPPLYPFEGTLRNWHTDRFNPAYFQHLEKRILELQKLGIEADLILFHPYDKGHWGFDRMTPMEDDRYAKYVIARLAAFRNVWWSLANEYDLLEEKSEEDWERLGQLVSRVDPFQHLLSIHNGKIFFNQTRPWLTHASIQSGTLVQNIIAAGAFRDALRKPIVYDEAQYEGNLPRRWGDLTAEQMVHRFWVGTIAGTYVGHSETYESPDDIIWWAKGGILKGQSPARIAFLRKIIEQGPKEGIEPIERPSPEYAGKGGEYYLVYFGEQTLTTWPFKLPKTGKGKGENIEEGMTFSVEVIDAWNMTITPVKGIFTLKKSGNYYFADTKGATVTLPGKPYIALRIRRTGTKAGVR